LRLELHNETRTFVAICGAAGMVLICLHQGHVVLDFARPASFRLLYQHRCGQMLLAALAWMTIEVLNLTLNSSSKHGLPGMVTE